MRSEFSVQIGSLMSRFRSGDREAAGALVDLFYPELRRIAAARMRGERPEHSWSPTILVNELYLELVKIKALRAADEDASERDAFLALAGFIMRRLLIHHSRPLYRKAHKVELEELDHGLDREIGSGPESLAFVEGLLDRLAGIDPLFRVVVEMRVFEGKTTGEISAAVQRSPRTVKSYWSFAKRWLECEISGAAPAV